MDFEKLYKRLKKLNNVLTIIVVFLGLYLISFPLLPELEFSARSSFTSKPEIDSSNQIVIPSIYVDTKIYESENYIDKGPFFIDQYKKPNENGVKVIAGHRFQYIFGQNTFYHLDKLQMNEKVYINWENKTYSYKIIDIFEVDPEDLKDIFDSEKLNILYIYTCTPIWTAKKRLIIKLKED